MKTLLVTGGCGFIGSNFIHRFLKTHPDWKILNLDALTYSGNPANNADLEGNSRYQFINGSILDAALVRSAVEQADAVINFAAETHVDRSIEDPDTFLKTNILGVRVLLDAARARGIEKFIQISTDEVYGSIAKGDVDENAPLRPNSPYAASKASADLLIRAYQVTFNYAVMIVRSSNNYGPYQYPEKVIPLFITNLLEKKQVPLYGQGINSREWIHVEDNCAAIECVFDRGRAGEIYNIGTKEEMTNLELAESILREMGFGKEMIHKVADRPGHDLRYSVEIKKIRDLGFKPRWTFEEGLKATIAWYRDHAEWWQPLKTNKYTKKQ